MSGLQIAIPRFDGFTATDAIGPYEVLSRLPDADLASSRRGGALARVHRQHREAPSHQDASNASTA